MYIFNCKNYLQIKSCAVGTICTPSYTNMFIDRFERKFYPFIKPIYHIQIYSYIKTFSNIYLRDDIFFIWTGSKTDLLNELNYKTPIN